MLTLDSTTEYRMRIPSLLVSQQKQPSAHVWALGALSQRLIGRGSSSVGPRLIVYYTYMSNDILSPHSKTRGRGEENEWKQLRGLNITTCMAQR